MTAPQRNLARRAVLGLMSFIVARPAFDAFLRRQIYRFPGLAGQIRAALSRTRRAQQTLPTVYTQEADLTDDARQVLQDLARGSVHMRQP